jgi:hypothetical protein
MESSRFVLLRESPNELACPGHDARFMKAEKSAGARIFAVTICSFSGINYGMGLLIRVVCLPLNPQFLHPKTQGAGINSQNGGGSGLAMHYPVRLLKNANDMRSLHLL